MNLGIKQSITIHSVCENIKNFRKHFELNNNYNILKRVGFN